MSSACNPSTTSAAGTDPPPRENKDKQRTVGAPFHQSAASYFSYPVTHVVSGLYRRLTDPPPSDNKPRNSTMGSRLRPTPEDRASSSSSS
ncbi:hypothetical protein AOCH_000040, partial [Aspergillus ochraceoroseus]